MTESREVLYRWHPWFGRMAWIFNVIEEDGEIILRCALEPLEATARVSEMSQWMFEPVVCDQIRYSVLPISDSEALRELERLLTDQSLAAQPNVVQAEHRPLSFKGEADATRSEPSSRRSTRSVSAMSRDAANSRFRTLATTHLQIRYEPLVGIERLPRYVQRSPNKSIEQQDA